MSWDLLIQQELQISQLCLGLCQWHHMEETGLLQPSRGFHDLFSCKTNLWLQMGQECEGSLGYILGGMAGVFRRTTLLIWEHVPHCYTSTSDKKSVAVCLMTTGHFACILPEVELEQRPNIGNDCQRFLTQFSRESEVTLTILSVSAFVVGKTV